MAFQVRLYTCGAQNNVVDKTTYLRNSVVVNCTLREESSIYTPTITIETPTHEVEGVQVDYDMTKFNYVHIPHFNRYYFISDIISKKNRIWTLNLKCDVLYSFASDIYKSFAVCTRSNLGNAYIPEASETEKSSVANYYVIEPPISSAALVPYNILLVSGR